MYRLFASICAVALTVGPSVTALGAEPPVDPKDLPRLKALEPADALKTFQVRKGLKIELAAAEPLVTSPVAISFDERGRMFVVEMRDYPDRNAEKLGRVRLLEDTDNDGVFDKATVYADGIPWPTGILCYDGGVFVATSPDIIYLKDSRGTGVADQKKVVFTGFAAGLAKVNVQGLVNGFCWGLDNRVHGATSSNGGSITRPDKPGQPPIDLRGRDFSFDPRTLDLRPESGGGQYGISFSTTGRKFVCSNSHHIQTIAYDIRYAGKNPNYAMPSPLVDIAVDGPAAEVFRTSPDEAWRVIRTKWRVSGQVPGMIEGGGRPSGYFTGATGITIYRGNALPPEFLDNAFIGDAGSNLVHRKLIHQQGSGVVAERPADEQKTEFLTSTDNAFRPVQMANGPDGALYVIDMYREVIEHPWSLPDSIKTHLDLHSGMDRGRIYRIVPQGFKRPPMPRLDKATTAELVATLEHENGWHRETAARLLFERHDAAAIPLLAALRSKSESPIGRMHALRSLAAAGVLTEADLLNGLSDDDSAVRVQAILLIEPKLVDKSASDEIWERLQGSPWNPSDSNVRRQLALSISLTADSRKAKILLNLAGIPSADAIIYSSVLNASPGGEAWLFANLCENRELLATPTGRAFMKELAILVGVRGVDTQVSLVIDSIAGLKGEADFTRFAFGAGMLEGLHRSGRTVLAKEKLETIVTAAAAVAVDEKQSLEARISAINLFGATGSSDHAKLLLSLLAAAQPQAIQSAALSASARLDDKMVATCWLELLPGMSPQLRSEAISLMVKRADRAKLLLAAIEAGKLRADVLSASQALALKSHRDKAVAALANKALSQPAKSSRDEVIKAFQPSLGLAATADKGKSIYQQRCISCHRSGGEGFAVGPDFVTLKTAGKEKNLVNILDPNREVAPAYLSYLVETKAGDTLTGLIVSETGEALRVRQPFGVETVVLRSDVRKMASQNLSLMPEGLEVGLSTQDVADLLEYIATAGAEKDKK